MEIMRKENFIQMEEFLQMIKDMKGRHRSLSFKQKLDYLISDFQVNWACRKYYRWTWILKFYNPYQIILFLLPHKSNTKKEDT